MTRSVDAFFAEWTRRIISERSFRVKVSNLVPSSWQGENYAKARSKSSTWLSPVRGAGGRVPGRLGRLRTGLRGCFASRLRPVGRQEESRYDTYKLGRRAILPFR
jgi:hypothetical protein